MSFAVLTSNENGANSLSDINANFALCAPLASPTFTGTPSLPTGTTAVTQSANDNSTKLATTAYVDSAVPSIEIETTAGATHSLTTVANQKVIVWAKGELHAVSAGAGSRTVLLKYNGVTKDTVVPYNENVTTYRSFALMYTETPGAGTHDITVTVDSDSIANVVIIVMKIS